MGLIKKGSHGDKLDAILILSVIALGVGFIALNQAFNACNNNGIKCPSILKTIELTNQSSPPTGTITTLSFTPIKTLGTYQVNMYINMITYTAGSVSLMIQWVDENGVTRQITDGAIVGNLQESTSFYIRAKNQPIQCQLNIAMASMFTYDTGCSIIQIV